MAGFVGNVGGPQLLVILIVALLVLGPDKLPSAARSVGRVFRDIRNVSAGFQREMRDAMDLVDLDDHGPTHGRTADGRPVIRRDPARAQRPDEPSRPQLDAPRATPRPALGPAGANGSASASGERPGQTIPGQTIPEQTTWRSDGPRTSFS